MKTNDLVHCVKTLPKPETHNHVQYIQSVARIVWKNMDLCHSDTQVLFLDYLSNLTYIYYKKNKKKKTTRLRLKNIYI